MRNSVFIKVQAACILGSIADYLITILLVEKFNYWYILANLAGNICGGSVQFFLCRKWAFNIKDGNIQIQAIKFILVFVGNLILSALGIYFFTHFLRINYLISKTLISIFLGVSYNYLMQKKFVFKPMENA
jgi:putative flippase GtrA